MTKYEKLLEIAKELTEEIEVLMAAEKASGILEGEITTLIRGIGIPANLKGYHFLRTAVEMAVADISALHNICNKLYPDIATEYSTKPTCVERAIRHALEVSWKRGNPKFKELLFGKGLKDDRPTNSEFIAILTDTILEGR